MSARTVYLWYTLLLFCARTNPRVQVWIYRDNEISQDHFVMTAINNLRKSGVTLNTLPVGPLSDIEVIDLVASSLRCTHAEAGPLGRLIHGKTQGNLFFTLHFFKGLYHKSLLWFDWDANKWCWDTDHIQWMENTDNVIDFLVSSLKRVPPYVTAVLHPAACVGHTFNMDIIRALPSCKAMQPAQIDHALQIALHQGLISHARAGLNGVATEGPGSKVFRFTHDRVQQAVYNLFPAHLTHLEIGRAILSQTVYQQHESADISNFTVISDSDLFTAMDHINHCVDIIAASDFDNIERQRVCVLNLRAGNMAKSSGAHETALKYINCGISLLPADCWTDALYPVALELHLLSAECEYMCGNTEWATAVFETILHFARTDLDKAAAFSLRMIVCTADSRFDEAVDAGLRACKLLGWEVDPAAAPILAIQLLSEVDKLLSGVGKKTTSPPSSPAYTASTAPPLAPMMSDLSLDNTSRYIAHSSSVEDLTELVHPRPGLGGLWAVSKLAFLPEMTDVKSIELMKVLSVMASFSFMTNPAIFALCACKMVHITLQHGSSPHSCLGFIYFAFYQATFDNFRTAHEFGMTARALSDRYGLDGMAVVAVRTQLCYAGWVAKWGQPLTACGPQLVQAYHDLLAAGDVLCATIAALMKVTNDVWTGESLSTLLAESNRTYDFLEKRCPLKSLTKLATSTSRYAMALMGFTSSNTSIDDPEPTTPRNNSPQMVQTVSHASTPTNERAVPTLTPAQYSILPSLSTSSTSVSYSTAAASTAATTSKSTSTSTSSTTASSPKPTVPSPTPTSTSKSPTSSPMTIASIPLFNPPAENKEPFNEATFLDDIRAQSGRMRYAHMCWHYVYRLKVLYILECYTEAHAVARDCKQLLHHLAGQTHIVLFHFYHVLTLVQLIKRSETDVKLRDLFMSEIKESSTVLSKWSESAPFNFAHRYQLVRAEVARISGRMEKAQGLYEQAIMSCRNHGLVHQEALSGTFHLLMIYVLTLM